MNSSTAVEGSFRNFFGFAIVVVVSCYLSRWICIS